MLSRDAVYRMRPVEVTVNRGYPVGDDPPERRTIAMRHYLTLAVRPPP